MITISVANQKGGSGKTTTAVNLAACLTMKGFRALLVDLDPQAQASTFLRSEDLPNHGTVFDALLETRDPDRTIKDLSIPVYQNLSLLPSEYASPDVESRLLSQPNRFLKLQSSLDRVKGDYDFAIIDCPPTLGVLTRNALMASDAVLLTIETSFLALHGAGKILDVIKDVKVERDLKVFAVATIYNSRTSFDREVLSDMKGYFEEMMLKTVIRSSVRLKECASYGVPIFDYAKNSKSSQDYKALTEEILGRVGMVGGPMRKLIPTDFSL